MSKDEKTRAKIGTGEVEGEKIVIREKADGVPFTEYVFMSKRINLLTDRVKREKHPSDAYIFTVMCSMLDIRTGICHAKQKDIVEATGLSKSEVSKAVKRLSTPLPPDFQYPRAPPVSFRQDCRNLSGHGKMAGCLVMRFTPKLLASAITSTERECFGSKQNNTQSRKQRKQHKPPFKMPLNHR